MKKLGKSTLRTAWLLSLCVSSWCAASLAQAQRITLVPIITTVAGNGSNAHSGDGGPAVLAGIAGGGWITLDGQGNLYVAESVPLVGIGGSIGYVRKVDVNGVITTVAGSGQIYGDGHGFAGSVGDGGRALDAPLQGVSGLAFDGAGNLVFGEAGCVVRRVNAGGIIGTLVGGPVGSYNCDYSGDGGPASQAAIGYVDGVALDKNGNAFIVDSYWDVVRRVDPSGIISTVAGYKDTSGANCSKPLGDNGPATQATLCTPSNVTTDVSGYFYIGEGGRNRVRKVDGNGNIFTLAGNGNAGFSGDGGLATAASLNISFAGPGGSGGVAFDNNGNLYIADSSNARIRRVDRSGTITTVAGNGSPGDSGDGGPALSAQINTPHGIVVDGAGSIYFSETPYGTGARVRKVSTPSVVEFGHVALGSSVTQTVYLSINSALALASTQAGGDFSVLSNSCPPSTPLLAGTVCAVQVAFTPSRAGLRAFSLVLTDNFGIGTRFSLEGTGDGSVVAFTPGVLSTIAGTGEQGSGGDGGPARVATLNMPAGLRVDGLGNLYITDYGACRIRKVDPGGTISTVAGNGICSYSGDSNPSGDGGPATGAALGNPYDVALDGAGNLYIADFENSRVRRVDSSGTISTVAGTGKPGFSGDGGAATAAQLYYVVDVSTDPAGNLYIADENNERVRRVDTRGFITTVAGNGVEGESGDGGPATSAALYIPVASSPDSAGRLHIAEYWGQRVRVVDAQGNITTFAGTGVYEGTRVDDNVPATQAALANPTAVAPDGLGNLYIANYGGNRISKVDAGGILTNVAGNGQPGASPDGGSATASTLQYPWGLAPDGFGNLYFSEIVGRRVRKLDVTSGALSFVTAQPLYVGASSPPQSVRVSNAGNAPLNFIGSNLPANFKPALVGNDCYVGVALAPGATCNLGVVFAPQQPGALITGTLYVFDSARNSPQSVALSGNAQPAPPPATVLDVRVLYGGSTYSLLGSTRNRLPWRLSAIQFVFSSPITSGDAASLLGLPTTGLNGLGTDTLTWTVNAPATGNLQLSLATSGADALSDAQGTPVAAWSLTLKLLYGDVNDDGYVSSADMVIVNNARGGIIPYTPFADLNGDDTIDTSDVQIVRSRIGAKLP